MKLYYMKGACSLATYICLNEAGAKFDATGLDRKNRTFADGEAIEKVNSKGYVPVLKLDDGQILTENVAILLYVSEQFSAKLMPQGALGRYRLVEALAFINSEIHKNFSPLFYPDASDDIKKYAVGNLNKRLGWLNSQLGEKKFLVGEQFSAADAYLYTVLGWAGHVKLDLGQWPNLKRFHGELGTRPSVVATLKAEGLIK